MEGNDAEETSEAPSVDGGDLLRALPKPKLGLADDFERARIFGALFQPKAESRTLGRYVVLDTLGRGGMGTVLRAFDRELDRPVALKVLHDNLGKHHTSRLRREAQAMAKLSHPNVVQVYEVGQVEGRTFVAMELVKGQTPKQWLQQEPRPGWRACVELYIQLGEGLAAAHAKGLVHRDFKPGNAIIDDKGRPRVLDFGLARQAGDGEDEPSSVFDRLRAEAEQTGPMDEALTRTGAVLGTPAYMPPEQMSGSQADARSDQFSFCVSLYEAVYGERPYAGSTVVALMEAMQGGGISPVPKGSAVPASLRTVLVRGLAVEPDQRWPSMEVLLEELRRRVAPRARRWLALGVTAGLVAVGGGLAWGQYIQVKDRCTGASAKLAGVWDEERKQEVQAAIEGTGLPYASATWDQVEQRLNAYAERWTNEHVAACEATTVRGEQSPEVMDLRMECLDDRVVALRAAVSVLADMDTTTVENAVTLAAELPGLSRCDDIEALRTRVPPPEDPAAAQEIEQLREQLAQLWAGQVVGGYSQVLESLDRLVERAEALEYEPFMAEARSLRGIVRRKTGQYEDAEQDLRRAHELAMKHRHDEVVLQALLELILVVGYHQARHDEGRVWGANSVAHATRVGDDRKLAGSYDCIGAVFTEDGQYEQARSLHQKALRIRERVGDDDLRAAPTLNHLGNVLRKQGEYEQARLYYEQSLQIWTKAAGADHPEVATALNNIGGVLTNQGKYEQAHSYYERALENRKKSLGSDHPDIAGVLGNIGVTLQKQGKYAQATLYYEQSVKLIERTLGPEHPQMGAALGNLGDVMRLQEQYEQAQAYLERAMRIRQKVLGAEHPQVATSLNSLGIVFKSLGQYEQAKQHLEQALQIWEETLGPEHPNVAAVLVNIGSLLDKQGRYEQAIPYYERALQMRKKALGPEHRDIAVILNNIGGVYKELGQYEQAKLHLEQALRIWEETVGPDHPYLSYALVGMASVELATNEPERAREHAERAVTIRESTTSSPVLVAEAQLVLVRALWTDASRRATAHALAKQIREPLVATDGHDAKLVLADVDKWLAEHRAPRR